MTVIRFNLRTRLDRRPAPPARRIPQMQNFGSKAIEADDDDRFRGTKPDAFVLERRLARARELLTSTDLSLSEVAFAVGFADQSHFTRHFRQTVGVSPGQFRKL